MNDFGILFWLVVLIMGILNLILFFKIWAMTNDVNSIKRIMLGQTINEEVDVASNNDGLIKEEGRFEEENDDFTTKVVIFMGILIFVFIMIVFTTA